MAGRSCQGVAIGDERSGNQDSSREATKFSGMHNAWIHSKRVTVWFNQAEFLTMYSWTWSNISKVL